LKGRSRQKPVAGAGWSHAGTDPLREFRTMSIVSGGGAWVPVGAPLSHWALSESGTWRRSPVEKKRNGEVSHSAAPRGVRAVNRQRVEREREVYVLRWLQEGSRHCPGGGGKARG
jgi:hypothetical protein